MALVHKMYIHKAQSMLLKLISKLLNKQFRSLVFTPKKDSVMTIFSRKNKVFSLNQSLVISLNICHLFFQCTAQSSSHKS